MFVVSPRLSIRKFYVAGARGKPSLVLDKEFGLWLGNETDEEVTFSASEIAGFNIGAFEEKMVTGWLLRMTSSLKSQLALKSEGNIPNEICIAPIFVF